MVTNQHVAADGLQKLSTASRDLVRLGYYARTRGEELKCPDLSADVLVSYENVSATRSCVGFCRHGRWGRSRGATRGDYGIERESRDKTGLRSDVVALYNGGEYWLYRYKRLHRRSARVRARGADGVLRGRLRQLHVSAPRPRRHVSPRVRKRPTRTRRPFPAMGHRASVAEGEFVVLAGYPGTTDRLLTVTQVRYQRDIGNPLQKQVWTARRDALAAYAKTSAEAARRANATIRSLENSLKRLEGQQKGIESARILAKKDEEERALRAAVAGNPVVAKGIRRRVDADRRGLRRAATHGAANRVLDPEPVDRANHALSLVRYTAGAGRQRRTHRAAVGRSALPGARGGGARRLARGGAPRAGRRRSVRQGRAAGAAGSRRGSRRDRRRRGCSTSRAARRSSTRALPRFALPPIR